MKPEIKFAIGISSWTLFIIYATALIICSDNLNGKFAWTMTHSKKYANMTHRAKVEYYQKHVFFFGRDFSEFIDSKDESD